MSAKEASIPAESKRVEERHTQEENTPPEASGDSEAQDGTKGVRKPANGEASQKSEPATDAPSAEPNAEPNAEPKVHVSAHERDREEQASRRVQEAQKYNNRDKGGRGGQRGGRGGYRNNNRFDPSKQEKTDDPVAIRKQVEFYFSDSNLLTDKFLFERVEGHKNVPVPLDVIHSFKRMQHFQPREAVIKALKESQVLKMVEDDTAIQRKEPLPEGLTGKSMDEVQKVHEDRSMAKSVYVKGFGAEESTTQFDIEAWFANYGLTNSVRLRRDPHKGFKGSVFVEFDTEETQQKFVSLDPCPKWKGKDLEIKSKKQYCDDKVEDINSGRIRRNSPNPRFDDRDKKRPRRDSPTYDNKKHDYAEGDDKRDWRQRRNEEASNGHRDNKRKAHGNSGRRDRGGKGRQDRNEERERQEKDDERDDPTNVNTTTTEPSTSDVLETKHDIPKDGTATETHLASKDTEMTDNAASKKRAHEGDDAEDGQKPAKKVDMKTDSQ